MNRNDSNLQSLFNVSIIKKRKLEYWMIHNCYTFCLYRRPLVPKGCILTVFVVCLGSLVRFIWRVATCKWTRLFGHFSLFQTYVHILGYPFLCHPWYLLKEQYHNLNHTTSIYIYNPYVRIVIRVKTKRCMEQLERERERLCMFRILSVFC